MVVRELAFSSDLLHGEQSYYAAESGVEVVLMNLEQNPVQHILDHSDTVGSAEYFPLIDNLVSPGDDFSFVLNPLKSRRFRLLRDTDDSLSYSDELAYDFDINVQPSGQDWQWKVLCKEESSGRTKSLQDTLDTAGSNAFLPNVTGKDDDGADAPFATWILNMTPKSCFFSVQNLTSSADLTFTFQPRESIAPSVATVRAIGQAGNRQKLIEFEYTQQTLGSLFDFVFFHWGN